MVMNGFHNDGLKSSINKFTEGLKNPENRGEFFSGFFQPPCTSIIPQIVEADASIHVHGWVVDLRYEADFWRLHGIVVREVNIQVKDTALNLI